MMSSPSSLFSDNETPPESVQSGEVESLFGGGLQQAVIDHLPMSVFWKDCQSRYLGCNEAFARNAGYASPSDVIGLTDSDLPWSQAEAEACEADDADLIMTGAAKMNFEERQTQGDGTIRWLRTSKLPIYSDDDRLVGILGIFEDITVRKNADLEKIRRQEQADNEAREKHDYFEMMSQELRAPLNIIMGYVQILQARENDLELAQMCDVMMSCGSNMCDLVDDISGSARADNGSRKVRPVAFSPTSIVKREFEQQEREAADKGLGYDLVLGESLPETIVSDPTKWGRIMRKLIRNAVRYTESGLVRVTLDADPVDRARKTQRFEFSVADTGVGMPEDEAAKVFARFSKADAPATGRDRKIGLRLARELARMLGGDLRVATRQGEGSQFTMTIDVPIAEAASPPPADPGTRSVAPIANATEKMRVLVVDDMTQNRVVVQTMVRQLGFLCENCEDGPAALAFLEQHSVDIVLTDVDMPGMDGLELAAEIRKRKISGHSGRDEVSIIAMTARALEPDQKLCFDAGMDGHIAKPVRLAGLRSVLKEESLLALSS